MAASVILAELGDFTRFDTARQVAAYAGLTPKDHQSGSSVHGQTTLYKLGNSRLRTALYMPAIIALRHPTVYPSFIARMRSQKRPGMTIAAALMRRILCLAYRILKSRKPYQPDYQPRATASQA